MRYDKEDRKKYCLLFCLVGLLTPSILFAQTVELIIQSQEFAQEEGLSSNYVHAMVKDNRGIVWIGTENGLNRFDGRSFKIFTTEQGLSKNNIKTIFSSGEILWCVHFSKEAGGYEDFSIFHTLKEEVISLEDFFGKNVLFKKKDVAYVSTTPFFIRLKDNTIYGLKNKKLVRLPSLSKGEYFLTTEGDAYFVLKNAEKDDDKSYIKKINSSGELIYKTSISDTYAAFAMHPHGVDAQNNHWFSFFYISGSGFLKITQDGVVSKYFTHHEVLKSLNITEQDFYGQEFLMPYIEKYGAFAYSDKHIFTLFNTKGATLFVDKHTLKNARDILLNDENDVFWIANANSGFYQLELKENYFRNYFFEETGGYRGITKINHQLYFNHQSGVSRFGENNFTSFSKILPKGLASIADKTNNLWISDYNYLFRYNPVSKETKSYGIPKGIEVWAMYADEKNTIWFEQKGLYNLNPETGQIIETNYNKFEELKEHTIYHFYKKKNGNVLLCTTGGLYEWHPEKGVLARYWQDGKGKYQLPTNDIRHLYFDEKDQSYWLGTGQEGLIHWQPNTGVATVFKFNRLGSNTIHAVYADEYNYLWMSTENGIIQFDKKNENFLIYVEKNGLITTEYNRVSSFQDTDGTIYFGSNKGFTAFHPKDFKNIKIQKKAPEMLIVELNQYLEKTKKIENLTAYYYKNKVIKLNSGDRFFTLSLALDNYEYNKDALYFYKIKDKDVDWLTSKTNELFISGLPYGKHILEIRASLENGQFSEVLTIPIIVVRPFYLTWWFVLLSLIFISCTTFFIIKWRTKRLQEQQEILKIEVQKRTEKIAVQTEELKELDKAKSIFFANVSHELRTPITLVQGPINSLLNLEDLPQRELQLLKIAQQNTANLLGLVNEILDLTKFENDKLALDNQPVLIYKFLKRIMGSFQSIAEKRQIDLLFLSQIAETLCLELDADKLEKIINNLLSNALKFTDKGGFVKLTIEENNEKLIIQVQDNGRGIPPEDVPNVFNRFYQSKHNTKAEGGLGIGLSLSMEFVKLMNGKMWVESSTEADTHGSTFFLHLPKIIAEAIPTETETAVRKTAQLPQIERNVEQTNLQTILLVEDNLDLREYIAFLLAPFYKVVTAEHGKEALAYLNKAETQQKHFPSLIISDMMMPIMDGLEFLQHVKSNDKWRSVPVIMLTARAELANKIKALRIGIDDYMVKPFDETELLIRIENLLQNYEERKTYALAQFSTTAKTTAAEQNNIEDTLVMTSNDDEIWLQKIEAITIQNLTNPQFSMDFIADELGLNRVTFYQRIKQLTGLTANQYVRAIRLKIAKDYLENQTYETVKDVAQAIGFSRIDYFTKLYEKAYSKKPSAYFK